MSKVLLTDKAGCFAMLSMAFGELAKSAARERRAKQRERGLRAQIDASDPKLKKSIVQKNVQLSDVEG